MFCILPSSYLITYLQAKILLQKILYTYSKFCSKHTDHLHLYASHLSPKLLDITHTTHTYIIYMYLLYTTLYLYSKLCIKHTHIIYSIDTFTLYNNIHIFKTLYQTYSTYIPIIHLHLYTSYHAYKSITFTLLSFIECRKDHSPHSYLA